GSGCPTGNVPAAKVEDAFIDELRGARPGAQFLSLFRRIALDRLADQKEEQAEIRRAAEWKDRTLEKQRQRLVQAYIYDAAIDEATYRAELGRLREEESLNRVRRHHAELDELDAEG